ncbi:hypothetical protein CapIbe_012773 [Capra ibex]
MEARPAGARTRPPWTCSSLPGPREMSAPAGSPSVEKHCPPFSPEEGSSARISPDAKRRRPRSRDGCSSGSWALAILRGGGAAAAAMRRTGGGAVGDGGGGGAELAQSGRRLRRRLESGQRRRLK